MKQSTRLWLTALILGWAFDFLFWKHGPGISFAIYVVLCLAGGLLVLGLEGLKPAWKALLLLLPILFFAVMTFVRQEPLSVFLSVILALFSMALLAVTVLGGRWFSYSLPDYIVNFLRLAGSMITRPLMLASERRKQVEVESGGPSPALGARSGWKRFWAVLRGVLIALPIVAVFAALLASADLVFARRLDEFIQLLRLEKLPEYLWRGFYILFLAYLLVGVFLHAAQKSRDEKLIGEEKPLVPPFLGFTEAAVVLGAVAALFAAFVVVQFQYFFGGQVNIHIEGYTYAEYARRGFGDLVAVAFFSLLLFLGLSAVVKREMSAQRWGFSGLGIALVALVGVMLVSALQRLLLYEAAYGFSRLRTYTHIFMFWLGLLLVAVVVLEIMRRERAFALAALLASLGFAATLTWMNVDASIVRQNVNRAVQGEELDVAYLASLSNDAVPALVELYQSPSLPAGTRDAVGASLACMTYMLPERSDNDWRTFHLSRWWGENAFRTVQEDIKAYVFSEDWPVIVNTPLGQEFECQRPGD